ncbi:MAG: hypothetical protein AB7D02_03195 [Candidatus Paceibacterota bacterium]|nr:hypothetical protein [Candidatus Paceibacterota bacterium]
MAAIISTFPNFSRRGRNKKRNKKPNTKKDKFSLIKILGVILILMTIFYIYLSLQIVNFISSVQEKNEEIYEVKSLNAELEKQITDSFSLEKFSKIAEEFNLTKAQEVYYLKMDNNFSLSSR